MCIYVRSNCVPHLHNAFYNGAPFYFEDCFQTLCPHGRAVSTLPQDLPRWRLRQTHLLSSSGYPVGADRGNCKEFHDV